MKDVKEPMTKDNEVLIKVKAVSINEWDNSVMNAKVFANRMMFGLFRPSKMNILGADVSGTIASVGKDVTSLKVGDDVLGDLSGQHWGGLAEYAFSKADALSPKPGSITFEEAAAVPQAGLLALQSFDHHGNVGPGTRVLINGGGGGVGSFAIQIAKDMGAEVTGVDTGEKLEFMSSTGADHVIDFKDEDFTGNGKVYDHIIDVVGGHGIADYRRSLAENGVCSLVGGSAGLMLRALISGKRGSKRIGLMMYRTNKGMDRMLEMVRSGCVRPVIDRTFPFEKTKEAFEYYGSGRYKGKIVITMDPDR